MRLASRGHNFQELDESLNLVRALAHLVQGGSFFSQSPGVSGVLSQMHFSCMEHRTGASVGHFV